MGKTSETIQKFIDRLRGAANVAPVDAAQEKQTSPVIKMPNISAQKPRDWKMASPFKARQPEKMPPRAYNRKIMN